MKRFWLCCAGMLAIITLHAQIDGPFSGNAATTSPIPGSSNTWANPAGSLGSDGSYATTGTMVALGAYTDYLVVTGFGFALPPGAIISGIVVDIERSDAFRRTADYSIRIVKNGAIGVSEHSSSAGYRMNDSYQSYGSSGDLWGEAWTDVDINSSGFGIAIAAQRSVGGGGPTAGKVNDVQITVFYNFVVTPVRLISFTVNKKNQQAELKWTTADEINMAQYEIERSSNGVDFATMGIVKSGNQSSRYTYSFIDEHPVKGISYYRIKMQGIAPSDITYSRIIAIDFDNVAGIALYPNPVRRGENLFINNSSDQRLYIQFYTIAGQKISELTINSAVIPAEKIRSPKGVILYRIFDRNQKLLTTGKLAIE